MPSSILVIRQRAAKLTLLVLTLALSACDGLGGLSAEEHYTRALDYREKGDIRAAVIEFKNVLQKDERNAEARWQLGELYLVLGDGASAHAELARAQSFGYSGENSEVTLVQALLVKGDYKDALQTIDKLPGVDDKSELLVLRGEALLGSRRVEDARVAFERVLSLSPERLDARMNLARIALSQRKLDAAEKYLDKAEQAQDSSRELEMALLRGELEFARGNPAEAIAAFEKAISLSPKQPLGYLGAARARLSQGDVEAAENHIKKAAEIRPSSLQVRYLQALLARQKNDLDGAKSALRDLLSSSPNHPQGLLLMASTHYAKQDFRQAEDSLVRFLAIAPNHVPGRKLLATVYLELDEPQRALEILQLALKLAPEDPQLNAITGSAFFAAGDPDSGTRHLQRAAALAPEAAAIRTQLGLSHLLSGSPDKALSELQSATEVDPKFTRADVLLIFAYLRKKDFSRALEAAQTLTKKEPDNPLAYNLVAVAQEGLGTLDQARQNYEKALEVRPDFVDANLNLARLDQLGSNDDQAQKRYETVLEKNPGNPKALVALARMASDEGQHEQALGYLERARSANPNALEVRLVLARFHLARGQTQPALEVANEAQALAPDQPAVLSTLGRIKLAAGKPEDALRNFERLVDTQPRLADSHFYLALARQRAGKPDAKQALRKALELKPSHLRAKALLGNLTLRDGDQAGALQIVKELQAQAPAAAAGYVLEGDTLMVQQRAGQAEVAYQEAFERSPSSTLAIKLNQARRAQGDIEGTYRGLQAWLKDNPDDVRVRLVLAGHLQGDGQAENAQREYEQILEQDPSNVMALNNLAWTYSESGNPKALETAEKALKVSPDRPEVLDTYGWLLAQEGKVERGISLLERAVRERPDNSSIRYHLGAALAKVGDKSRARRELEASLSSQSDFPNREEAEELLDSLK